MGDSYQERSFGYQMCFSPSALGSLCTAAHVVASQCPAKEQGCCAQVGEQRHWCEGWFIRRGFPRGCEGGMLPGATAAWRWDSWRKLRGRFGWLVSSVTMVTLIRQLDVKKGGYFKAACKDGLATHFLSCSLWHAPPTCFLWSLHNSWLYI